MSTVLALAVDPVVVPDAPAQSGAVGAGTVVALLLGLILGAVAGFGAARALARRESDADAARLAAELGRQHAEASAGAHARTAAAEARAERLAQENDELLARARSDANLLRALEPVQQAVNRMDRQVGELERERLAQYTALTTQLDEARRADAELRNATTGLERALRSSSARGAWGEMELRRVLELAGMSRHTSFMEQASHDGRAAGRVGSPRGDGRRGRPDVLVHLPGERVIPVDAKAPMDAYLEASAIDAAGDGPEATAARDRRARLLAAHAKALRGHVDALASRDYQAQVPGSVDLVVLFIPAEGLLSAALDQDAALLEYALGRGVALATPSSLLALLRSVAAVWAQESVTDEAREILALGRELTARLSVVAGHLDTLGGALRSSVRSYNQAVGSIEGRLLVTARRFDSLADPGRTLPTPTPVDPDDAQVRAWTALTPAADPPGSTATTTDTTTPAPAVMEPASQPWSAEAERTAALGPSVPDDPTDGLTGHGSAGLARARREAATRASAANAEDPPDAPDARDEHAAGA